MTYDNRKEYVVLDVRSKAGYTRIDGNESAWAMASQKLKNAAAAVAEFVMRFIAHPFRRRSDTTHGRGTSCKDMPCGVAYDNISDTREEVHTGARGDDGSQPLHLGNDTGLHEPMYGAYVLDGPTSTSNNHSHERRSIFGRGSSGYQPLTGGPDQPH